MKSNQFKVTDSVLNGHERMDLVIRATNSKCFAKLRAKDTCTALITAWNWIVLGFDVEVSTDMGRVLFDSENDSLVMDEYGDFKVASAYRREQA